MEQSVQKKSGAAMRVFKWILLIVLTIILLLALAGYWVTKKEAEYELTAVPYMEAAIPEIATWDPDIAWGYFDDELKEGFGREEIEKIIIYMSKLGALESMEHPQFQQVNSSASTSTGVRKTVEYVVDAVFEAGDATISITLTDRDGEFSILNLNIDSMVFAETDQ